MEIRSPSHHGQHRTHESPEGQQAFIDGHWTLRTWCKDLWEQVRRAWRKSASSTDAKGPHQPPGRRPLDCCLGVDLIILSSLRTCLLGDHCLCIAVKGSCLLQGGAVDGFRRLSILLWALLDLGVNIFTQAKSKVRNPCGICALKVVPRASSVRCGLSVCGVGFVGLGVMTSPPGVCSRVHRSCLKCVSKNFK